MFVEKICERMCVICRTKKNKRELIRISKNKSENVSIDFDFKAEGRGAYICKSEECIKNAEKRSAIEKSFKQKIDKSIYKKLADLVYENKEN